MRIFSGLIFSGAILIGCGSNASVQEEEEKVDNSVSENESTAGKPKSEVKKSVEPERSTPIADTKKKETTKTKVASLPEESIATVNDTFISSTDFERAAARKVPADGKSLNLEERKEILDGLVKNELLYQKAFERKLYLDPKVKKVMLNALLREEVFSQIKNSDFSEEDLRKYFDDHKEEFTVPEKVQFSRILIKKNKDRDDVAAKAEADRIYAELQKNKSAFGDLADKFSDGPYRRRGGDVGFVSKKGKPGLSKPLVSKAFEMSINDLSSPIKSKDGYSIILLKERRDAMERSFEQMKGTVMRKLKNEKIAQMYDNYTGSLMEGATVSIDEEKLSSIEVKTVSRPNMGLPPQGGLQAHPGKRK